MRSPLLPPPPHASPHRTAPLQLTNHVLMVLPAAVVGIICGVGAILFTLINLKVCRRGGCSRCC